MKDYIRVVVVLSALMLGSWLDPASAATTTQTTTLHPGWNAVFLEVEPGSTAPADVFSAATFAPSAAISDLVSVWRWIPSTSTVEFIQDETNPIPEGSEWLVYHPGQPVVSNLHAIHGETAYLINLGGSSDVTWTVTGQPVLPHLDWKTNSFNFVGFHLAPGAEPFFGDFFSSSLAHDGQKIFILNSSGDWEEVADPQTTQMRHGEGFWVYCNGSSKFTGPISVQPDQSSGLHYGKTLSEQNLTLRNVSAAGRTLSLLLSSLTGTVHYWVFEPGDEVAGWTSFPSPLNLAVPATGSQRLRLGVRRAGLAADTTYEANLTVTDGAGMRILLPVSVTGVSYSGLWVGDATITKVSQPANQADPGTAVETGSEFSFRLILHVDGAEPPVARLVSQVIQMWQEGTWMPDPDDLGKFIVDQPGHFVLLSDDSLVSSYSGAAMRDGQLVGRRISSPAFPSLTAAQRVMSGSFDPSPGNALEVTIDLPHDDPTNPFRHLYHPEHGSAPSYGVQRVITLTFQDEDSEGRPITGVPTLGWGSSEAGGIYQETITGLHKDDLHIAGTFLLHKASDVDTLTSSSP